MARTNSGILRKIMLGGGGLLIVMVSTLIIFRSTVLEQVGKFAFDLYGFDEVTLTVKMITSDQVTIEELSLSDQIILRDITLHYALLSLPRGEIFKAEIRELFVDLSNPDEGPIKRILDLTGHETGHEKADQKLLLPEIILQSGKVINENGSRSLLAEFSGTLSGDQTLKAQGMVQAKITTASGSIVLENTTLSLDANIITQSAAVTVEGGVIRHDSPTPDWAPLSLSGNGSIASGLSNLKMSVKTSNGQPLAELSGSYDIASGNGDIGLGVAALSFHRDGLQPMNLTRYAADIPLLDGTLKIAARATISGGDIVYDGEIQVEDLVMEITDGLLSSDQLPLEFQGRYQLEKNTQAARITLQQSNLTGAFAGQTLNVGDLTVDMDVRNFANDIELKTFSGELSDAGPVANFAPLSFELSGGMTSLQKLSLKGKTYNKSEQLKVDLTAGFEMESGEGALSFRMSETKVGTKGVQLAALSRHLKEIGSSLSGLMSASGEIAIDSEGNLLFSSLKAALRDGKWQDKTMRAEEINLAVAGGQKGNGSLFEGDLSGYAGNVQLDSQNMSVSKVEAGFGVSLKNLIPGEAGQFRLSDFKIAPKEGALFKEVQNLKGEAKWTGKEVDFTLALTSDFLGEYLHLDGRHSTDSQTGSARVKVIPLSFAEGGLQPSDLIAVDAGITIVGDVVPSGEISWSSEGLKTSGDIGLDDLSIKAAGGSISDASGMLHIDEFIPLTISSPQEVTAREAVAGIPLDRPFLRFRVATKNSSPVLYIDRLTVGLVGGSALVEGALIDTGAEVSRLEVQLTQLDLEEVMALSNVEELVATGRVSGRIPMVFGGARLLVDDGLLEADGPGVLKMTSDAARKALGGGGEQAELLLDVLENFRYSELSIKVTKTESGEDTVKLHAAGSNPEVENNRPVILNINLTTSLDKIFNAVLDGYLLSEKALRATVDGR